MNMKSHNPHARIQRGDSEGPDPHEKSQYIWFLSNIGPDSLKSQANIQCWASIGPPAKHHFISQADDGSLLVVF